MPGYGEAVERLRRLTYQDFVDVGMEDCWHEYQTLDVDVLHHDRLKTTKVNRAVSMEAMSFADLKKYIEEPGGQLIFVPCDKNENGKAKLLLNADDISYVFLHLGISAYEEAMQAHPSSGHALEEDEVPRRD